MDFSELLPEEIIFVIFSNLDSEDIFRCLGVCKRWRFILNVNSFWKKLCSKARIFNRLSGSRDPLPLCDWAETYFRFRCIPYQNWKRGNCQYFSIEQENEYFREAWDGHYLAVYYFLKGKINVYSVFDKITLIQVVKVSLPEVHRCHNNVLVTLNDSYMIVARCNVAVIFKKGTTNLYEPIQSVSATGTFTYGIHITSTYTKIHAEIAWGYVWLTATTVKDICIINLNDFSKKYISGKAYLAFNDDTKLVVAWTESLARVISLNGVELVSLVREKIKAIDYNSKYLILKVENGLEVINIKTGSTVTLIKTSQKIEFALSNTLLLLEGNNTCVLSSISLENGNRIWTKEGLKGRAFGLCTIGSKYLFVVPSFKKNNYALIDYKGNFISENILPEGFKEFYNVMYTDILPFLIVTNLNSFDIVSFM